jgi:hypothetical protein
MSRPQVKITSIGITSVVGLAVACSAAPAGPEAPPIGASTSPPVATAEAPAAAPSGDTSSPTDHPPAHVLARFDGSFDATSKKLTFSLHPNEPGVIVAQGALSYGLGAGQVYLHTESVVAGTGQEGEGQEEIVFAMVYPENGTGATVTGFTVTVDSVAPAGSVGIVPEGGIHIFNCSGTTSVGPAGAVVPPCSISYGDVAPTPSFPTPAVIPAEQGQWYIYSAGLGNFTFSGTVSSASDRRVKRNVRPLAEAMPARRARGKKRRR